MSAPSGLNLKLYPSPPDARDHIIKASGPLKSKGIADLSSYCTSVKDQGMLGACTAFACVGAMEYLHKRFGGIKSDDILSERFTYYATRVHVLGWVAEDSGAYVRDAMKSLVKFGSCLESSCVYNNDYKTPPDSSAYNEALRYQVVSYARFEDGSNASDRKVLIENIKASMDSGFPVVCGFVCYSNVLSAVNGVIPPKNGQIIGGHAIMLVGYDDNKQWFKFKNSWGMKWGDNGYGYLSYDYYFNGDMFDIWVIQSAENNDVPIGLNVIKPDPPAPITSNKDDVLLVFSKLAENIDKILDKKTSNATMNEIMLPYIKTKPRIATLINSIKSILYGLSS